MHIKKDTKPYKHNDVAVKASMKSAFKQDDIKEFAKTLRYLAKR